MLKGVQCNKIQFKTRIYHIFHLYSHDDNEAKDILPSYVRITLLLHITCQLTGYNLVLLQPFSTTLSHSIAYGYPLPPPSSHSTTQNIWKCLFRLWRVTGYHFTLDTIEHKSLGTQAISSLEIPKPGLKYWYIVRKEAKNCNSRHFTNISPCYLLSQ